MEIVREKHVVTCTHMYTRMVPSGYTSLTLRFVITATCELLRYFTMTLYELTGRTLVPYETHTVSNHTRIIIVSTVPDWRESRKNNDGLRP